MKKLIIALMCLTFVFAGCDKDTAVNTTGVTIKTTLSETQATTATKETETTTVTTETEPVTTETAPPLEIHEQPKEFSIENVSSVEDYFGGDVLYKADFDGDGKDETCTVKIVGHGTQCYVEEIEITKANGEKMVVEHPITATGMRSYFHMGKDSYSINLDDALENITYPFDALSTPEEHLIPIAFGDIFDYSVIGDKLYFSGSLACGFSEVVGEVIYEYAYRDGALRISRIGYIDAIGDVIYDLRDVYAKDSLLVDPCMGGDWVESLPDAEPIVTASAIMKQPEFFVYEKGLTYYVKWRTDPLEEDYTYRKYTLTLPEGYTDGEIISDGPGGGSGELGFLVHAKKGDTDVALWYLFYADRLKAPIYVWENEYLTFTPDEGSKLSEIYAYTPYCIARMYVSTEDERVLYYIVDHTDWQRIRYDKIDGAHPPMAKDLITFADVNFDGEEDICLKLGNFGAQGAVNVRAYLRTDYNNYILCESFEEIPNPVIDAENKQILGTNRESAAEYSYRKFEFKDGEFVKVADILYNADTETVEMDGEVFPSAEFETDDGLWNIPYTKWFDIITE